MSELLALGIQKPTGNTNLGEETAALLMAGGLNWQFPTRVDYAPTNIKGLEIVGGRIGDLTRECARGELDLAIVGRDHHWNYVGPNTPIVLKELGFGQCTIKLGVRKDFPYEKPEDLEGQTIATSYGPGSARWFRDLGISVNINEYTGGEERGVARLWRPSSAAACIAISETGYSMTANTARPVLDILKSEAILIANPEFANQPQSQKVVWQLLRVIMIGIWQTQYTLLKFNYPENQEEVIMQQTPARESPTKMPLDEKEWKAAETLMPIGSRDEVETNLLSLGARDLVYTNVTRMIPNLDDVDVTRMMRAIYGDDWQFSKDLLESNP